MRKKVLNSLQIKFMLILIGVLWLSSITSFMLVITFGPNIINTELQSNQTEIAYSMKEIARRTDLNPEEIIPLYHNLFYQITIIEDDVQEKYDLELEELQGLKEGEILYINGHHGKMPVTLFTFDDQYLSISLIKNNRIIDIVRYIIAASLLISVLTGSCLMAMIARRLLKPIQQLSSAMKEVARGNFDLSIEQKCDDEIGQLTQSFNKMAKELKGIEYLRKDFINSVSHEFKTPLASIQGFAKLLKNQPIPTKQSEDYTDIIIQESGRLSKLCTNILNLSKLENQQIVIRQSYFSLDEQIRRTIVLLEPEWSSKNLELLIELDTAIYYGEMELTQQIWMNLLSNAIKFSPDDGIIRVELIQTEDDIEVSISDNGIGMSLDTQSRIFEKFYQADKSRARVGHGLGLSIVKRIVELSDGQIIVQSKLGEGTTMTVKLKNNKEINCI